MLPLSANPDYKGIQDNFAPIQPYYDISIDDDDNVVGEVFNFQALDQAIEMVLCTEPGERLFNIEFQSPLYKVFFENLDNVYEYADAIFDAIEKWVPITINRAEAEISSNQMDHSMSFSIPYVANELPAVHYFNRKIYK